MIYTVAIVGLIAMLFASIPRNSVFRYGLEVAWLIIFVFLAIRYDFGNDYMAYKNAFDYQSMIGPFEIDEEAHHEPGWQFLNYLFRSYGFTALVVVLTAFECFVFYSFIKEYVPYKYYWFSIFLYVFDPNNLLIGASMMRNTLAIALFIWSIRYIKRRKLFPYLITIFLATQVHSSAIVLYPVYLLGYVKQIKLNKWGYSIIIILYLWLSFGVSQSELSNTIQNVAALAGEEQALEYYTAGAVFQEGGSGLGAILLLYIFCYLIFTLYKRSDNVRLLFLILVIGTFVKPFALIVPMIGRFAYYFNIFGIVCFPIILGGEKEKYLQGERLPSLYTPQEYGRLGAIMCIVLITIYSYCQFFQNPVWIEKFSTYHTIFEL